MVQALRPGVGAVGARLLYPDQTLQHAGVLLGIGGVANHAHLGWPGEHPGYFSRAQLTQEMAAVTAACLVVRRDHYRMVGGLDAIHLKVAFNDVDFCLKLREIGLQNVYVGATKLIHHESVSRGQDLTPKKPLVSRRRWPGCSSAGVISCNVIRLTTRISALRSPIVCPGRRVWSAGLLNNVASNT